MTITVVLGIIILAFPILVFVFLNKINQQQEMLNKKVDHILKGLSGVEQIEATGRPQEGPKEKPAEKEKPGPAMPEAEVQEKPLVVEEVKAPEKPVAEPEPKPEPEAVPEAAEDVEAEVPKAAAFAAQEAPAPPTKTQEGHSSWLPKDFNYERFIGENLLNKIGIIILLLGLAFFIKYAIDRDWINEVSRVGIGFLIGGGLIYLGKRLSAKYRAFSSVLTGGGLALFYITVAIAFHEYAMFSKPVAFILTLIITGISVWLSVLYDRIELAVFAVLGGYGSPFIVTDGTGNYLVLMVYLVLLSGGWFALSFFKKWPLVNIVSFALTAMVFGGWIVYDFEFAPLRLAHSMLFMSILFVIFHSSILLQNTKADRRLHVADVVVMLVLNVLYLIGMGVYLEELKGSEPFGYYAAAVGAYNLLAALLIYKLRGNYSGLVNLLAGISISWFVIAVPGLFSGVSIPMLWASEAVLLYWLSMRLRMKMLRLFSFINLILAIMGLMSSWVSAYAGSIMLTVVFNKIFLTGIVFLAALGLLRYFSYKEKDEEELYLGINMSLYRGLLDVLIYGLVLLVPLFEIAYQINYDGHAMNHQSLPLMLWTGAYTLAVMIWSVRNKNEQTAIWSLILMFIISIVFLGYMVNIREKAYFTDFISGKGILINYLMHYVVFLAYVFLSLWSFFLFRMMHGLRKTETSVMITALSFLVLMGISLQADFTSLALFSGEGHSHQSILDASQRGAYSTIWSIFALIIMVIGLRNDYRVARILSLAIFGITLLKLFVYDLSGISETGRIISFIILGIILLVISFMYQKIKDYFLQEDEVDDNNENNTIKR